MPSVLDQDMKHCFPSGTWEEHEVWVLEPTEYLSMKKETFPEAETADTNFYLFLWKW